jgi:transcriptional/translational regulatory protein YebC/TACO1
MQIHPINLIYIKLTHYIVINMGLKQYNLIELRKELLAIPSLTYKERNIVFNKINKLVEKLPDLEEIKINT